MAQEQQQPKLGMRDRLRNLVTGQTSSQEANDQFRYFAPVHDFPSTDLEAEFAVSRFGKGKKPPGPKK
jgi:hypothetical protein